MAHRNRDDLIKVMIISEMDTDGSAKWMQGDNAVFSLRRFIHNETPDIEIAFCFTIRNYRGESISLQKRAEIISLMAHCQVVLVMGNEVEKYARKWVDSSKLLRGKVPYYYIQYPHYIQLELIPELRKFINEGAKIHGYEETTKSIG